VRALPRLRPAWATDADHWRWFYGASMLLTGLLVALSPAITLGFDDTPDRLAGPLACVMAAATWALLPPVWPRLVAPDLSAHSPVNFVRYREFPAYVALLVGVLAVAETAWACLDPELPAAALQFT